MHLPVLSFTLIFLCTLLSTPLARAHDPFEAFHTATLHPNRLELTVTMASSTAVKLITPAPPAALIPSLTPENLAEHRPRLLRAAATLFILTSTRTQLTSRAATIELTEENDLVFRITYPHLNSGRLLFSAAYLRRLGDGYGGLLEVNDHAGKNLGWEQLLWSHPNCEVTIPK